MTTDLRVDLLVEELTHRLAVVRARHTPTDANVGDGDGQWCMEDGHEWPCDTRRALDGEGS